MRQVRMSGAVVHRHLRLRIEDRLSVWFFGKFSSFSGFFSCARVSNLMYQYYDRKPINQVGGEILLKPAFIKRNICSPSLGGSHTAHMIPSSPRPPLYGWENDGSDNSHKDMEHPGKGICIFFANRFSLLVQWSWYDGHIKWEIDTDRRSWINVIPYAWRWTGTAWVRITPGAHCRGFSRSVSVRRSIHH